MIAIWHLTFASPPPTTLLFILFPFVEEWVQRLCNCKSLLGFIYLINEFYENYGIFYVIILFSNIWLGPIFKPWIVKAMNKLWNLVEKFHSVGRSAKNFNRAIIPCLLCMLILITCRQCHLRVSSQEPLIEKCFPSFQMWSILKLSWRQGKKDQELHNILSAHLWRLRGRLFFWPR